MIGEYRMSDEFLKIFTILYAIITLIVIVVIVFRIKSNNKKRFTNALIDLERNKNLILNGAILSELNKVESLINNKDLEDKYNYWKSLFKELKDKSVPKIEDDLIDAEELVRSNNLKDANDVFSKVEFEIFVEKSKAEKLLDDIKEITLSEQKNREIVTKLKSEYRTIFLQYNNGNKDDYKLIQKPLELQFENVDKLFSTFEIAMENNVYSEVGKIVKALDDTIGNLKIVIEEAPSIIMMGKTLVPTKIEEVKKIKDKMVADGYNLDYLKIDHNIEVSEKKVADIFDRLKVLNLEDSVFELKTIIDTFDSMYDDFDKEKIAKKQFDEYIRSVIMKCKKLTKIINGVASKIDDIKYSYDLTDDDIKIIGDLQKEVNECTDRYNACMDLFREHNTSYSHLTKEMESIANVLRKAEDKLSYTLKSLGSLKEDELRAREQLVEIKDIMKQSRNHMKSYKLPIVPKDYYIQYEEARDAIKNMEIELGKVPINIKLLNTRVDTARDLVLKVFNTSLEIVKTASMAENAIVYGNRYRAINSSIDSGLTKAERDFLKGNFKSSLEYAINSINVIEPGIHQRLLDAYKLENESK
jgi:septation ring formation regulator